MVNFSRSHQMFQLLLGIGFATGLAFLSVTNGTGAWNYALSNQEGQATINVENYDGDGKKELLTYPLPPQRILVTYPGATELLIALGLSDKIVGTVSPYGLEPDKLSRIYASLPTVSAPFVPSREEALALKPDLIMGWNHHFQPNALGSIDQWYSRGVATYVVPATIRQGHPTIESTLYPFLKDAGQIFGVEGEVASYQAELESRIHQVVSGAQNQKYHPQVMVLQTYGNSTYTLYGQEYVVYDIVQKAGGRMINSKQLNGIGPERVLAFDPDYIVLVVAGKTEEDLSKAFESLKNDSHLSTLRAVRDGHVIPVDFSEVNNGNGRMVDALEKIYRGFYPSS